MTAPDPAPAYRSRMKKAGFKCHVFVCLNERPADHPRGCCMARGSEEVFKTLKLGVKKAGLSDE